MLTAFKKAMIRRGPNEVLTLIMSPFFIAYGLGLLDGYRSSLLLILGLPPWAYAMMFIVAGILKMCGLIFKWGRFSHTIGVTVCTFWASLILVFAHSIAGWVGALPWIALAVITFMAAVWPDPIIANAVTPMDDDTNPAMRAIEYLLKRDERTNGHADTSKR